MDNRDVEQRVKNSRRKPKVAIATPLIDASFAATVAPLVDDTAAEDPSGSQPVLRGCAWVQLGRCLGSA
eukprot:7636987-Lingulodinium_polyedra.AAC.1